MIVRRIGSGARRIQNTTRVAREAMSPRPSALRASAAEGVHSGAFRE